MYCPNPTICLEGFRKTATDLRTGGPKTTNRFIYLLLLLLLLLPNGG
jgi:hypothetical protein